MRIKQILTWAVAGILLLLLWGIPKVTGQSQEESYEIVCMGDSMLAPVKNLYGVVDMLRDRLDKAVFNGAFGGTRLSRTDVSRELSHMHDSLSMVALAEAVSYGDFGPQQTTVIKENGSGYFADTVDALAKIDFQKVDILLIEHGTNDYNVGVPLLNEEDAYDEYTFSGALRKTLTILQKKLPNTRIILVTPTYCWFPQWGETCETYKPAGAALADYVQVEKQIAGELGVEIIDNYELFPHTSIEDCDRYTVDGLHATELGREMIAGAVAEYLLENP